MRLAFGALALVAVWAVACDGGEDAPSDDPAGEGEGEGEGEGGTGQCRPGQGRGWSRRHRN